MTKTIAPALAMVALLGCSSPALSACNIVNGKGYGDCSGVRINSSPPAILVVEGVRYESGIIAGATVKRSGRLTLSGMSQGPIAVQSGGSLHVQGTAGSIQCTGGTVTIDGMVSSLSASGCAVEVSGVLGQLYGTAEVLLNAGAVFQGSPLVTTQRFSTTSDR